MKYIRSLSLVLTLLITGLCGCRAQQGNSNRHSHRIMSCNIRVALDDDEAKGYGWSTRKDICIGIIKSYNPDIICLQEVLRVQNEDMKKAFNGYFVVGFDGPCMDAFPEGYHGIAKNTILFSKNRYEFVSSGCYWLSDTPLIAGSKSWETARARHCNWVRIKEKATGKEFRVLDVHLDHVAQSAKEQQIKLVMTESEQYDPNFPQILAGDFNASMENNVIKIVKSNNWTDTYAFIHGETEAGKTTHGFEGVNAKPSKGGRIDFIFSRGSVRSLSSEIVRDDVNGIYPSDHYFIYADVMID